MDYEKKYNHALEVVRELQKDWASTQNRAAREIELAFPELKESEEEGIRKFIIDCIDELRKANADNADFNGRCSEAIAYLEEQKEQKPAEKPKSYNSMDDFIADALIEMVEESDLIDRDKKNRLVWIERHRTKPAEWSEEDKRALNDAIVAISMYANGQIPYILPSILLEDVERLKSLPPYWKPSKEQMDILDKVYHYLWADRNATADMQDGLGDFIDELKNL